MAHLTRPTIPIVGWAAGLSLALVGLGLARVAGGWTPLASDDARYLFVGLSLLDGQGATTPSGDLYLQRSPVYGVALAVGARIVGGDPLDGARLVALVGSLVGLIGAVRVAWLTAGAGAALGASIAVVATPIVWSLLPSLRIDLPQAALIVALLLSAWRPTTRRWAAAGVLLGLVVLVKETSIPLLALPIALVGTVPVSVARRLAVVYAGAAVLTAGWWWVVVWAASGQVFPADALAVVEAREVTGSLRISWLAVPMVAAALVGWSVVAWRARDEAGPRLLVTAGLGLVPAAAYAAAQGLSARNFAAIAVLSAVSIGIAGATLVAALRPRLDIGPPGRRARGARGSVLAGAALTAIAAFSAVGPIAGQWSVPRPASDRLTDEVVEWVAASVPRGGRIVMPFHEREAIALRRYGQTTVAMLRSRRVDPTESPESYVWMGLRDTQLFGYLRRTWQTDLVDPPARFLVLVGPHPFTPFSLVGGPGLSFVAEFERDGDRADILRIDPVGVAAGIGAVPLHLDADAALVWLDLAAARSDEDDAATRLLAARPVVSGTAIQALIDRLGARACATPASAGTMLLTPASTCPA